MSHFTVIVAGDDHEASLAPFNENTDDPEHLEEVDVSEETKKMYEDYEHENYKSLDDYIENCGDRFSRIEKLENGEFTLYQMQVKQPKWDWYVVGGRWSNFFLHKNGSKLDQIKAGDIDWKTLELEVIQKAMNTFSNWEKCWSAGNKPKSFDELYEMYKENREAAVKAYNAQPVIAMYEQNNKELVHYGPCPVQAIGFDKEAYIEKALNGLLVPFAYLDEDGMWHERGQMGWFASVANAMDRDVWDSFIQQKLKSLHPDTTLTLVDCHV